MSDHQGPTGEHGRLQSCSWSRAALIFGAGHGFGFGSATVTLAFLLSAHLSQPADRIYLFAALSCLLVFEPWFLVSNNDWIAKSWERVLAVQPVNQWRLFIIGILSGWVGGVVLYGLMSAPWAVLKVISLPLGVFGAPWLGIWWIARLKPIPTDRDYDDEMTGDQTIKIVDLPDLAATEAFGRRLGALLFPNAVVALIGPLGAGKTHLARAVAEGLGIANPAAVTSPTFTLIHEYPARLPIYHFDAYRLNGPNEFLDLGVSEYYEAGGVCLIEWADKVEAVLPAERLTIRLVPVDENRRRAEVVGVGERYEALARQLSPEGAAENSPGRKPWDSTSDPHN